MGSKCCNDAYWAGTGRTYCIIRRLNMQKRLLHFSCWILFPLISIGQEGTSDSAKSAWSFSTSAYYYIVPSEKNTASIIGYADHHSLHFEARYNYEDHKTGSVFAGWRFETGTKFVFGATPMVGLVFGNTDGVGPALELDASYGVFDFYSETEYIIDFAG